jgi:hypothetical protein
LLCIKQFIPKKRRELQQRGVAFVLLFLVLSFVFKASFTLGLESFVEIWEGKNYRARGACMYVSIGIDIILIISDSSCF